MQQRKQLNKLDNGIEALAPAKINLSLLISGKRPDGFHNIETLMAKVNWYDHLLFEQTETKDIEVVSKGPHWAPQGKENLIYKACRLIKENYCPELSVKVTLTKNIPAGSGLGSASSDAAATLLALKELEDLDIDDVNLAGFAERLGSDVPFFLNGPLAFCTQKGEKVQEISKNFNFSALLILPNINCCTKSVYSNYTHNKQLYRQLSGEINALINKNKFDLVAEMCANMLQGACFKQYSDLAELKKELENAGLTNICLSGSGACLFCLFDADRYNEVKYHKRNLSSIIRCNTVIVSNNSW
jgi:4-diphosphocytidyl-2-C-methyl-D-erythritol kinase